MVVAGYATYGRWDGVFIDERNRISLARFQLVVWTVLLVSALFTAGLTNVFDVRPSGGALAIKVPAQIWAVVGLAGFSLIAVPAILDTRIRDGLPVFSRENPGDAAWIDLIISDASGKIVDITKVQHLAFTVLLIAVYGFDISNMLKGVKAISEFPAIDSGFVALLAISHAAYLSGKTLDRPFGFSRASTARS
jgi:hypothetical protein